MTDTLGGQTDFYFNHTGAIEKTVDPLDRAVEMDYDALGNMTRMTDPLGRSTTFAYDTLGNVVRSTNALGLSTRFSYTSHLNRLDLLTDAAGNVTDYDYDAAGNLVSITYADASLERWQYDASGNVDQWINRRGQSVQYTLDAEGRVTQRTYEDGTSATFTYDARGNLIESVDPTGTTAFTHNANDYLTRIDYPDGRFLQYTYDAAGRRASMTDELGHQTAYAYDSLGRLWQLTDESGSVIVTYSYDALSRLGRTDKGNGTYTTHDYDAAGQLLHLVNHGPDHTVTSRFDYTYDAAGLRTSMTTLDGAWTYEYDAIGQLTHAVFAPAAGSTLPAQDIAYKYDPLGNRLSTTINGETTAYTSNELNQYTQVGDTLYEYDEDGNLIRETTSGQTTEYVYNTDNKLVMVTMPDGTVYEYTYDAFGNRVAVSVDGVVTEYVIDPTGLGNVIGQYDGTADAWQAGYTHGFGLVNQTTAAGSHFYDFDALGSTAALTDALGAAVNTYAYLPFGGELAWTETVANDFQFVGQWGVMNEGSGLDFMRARYYDSCLGRFASHDPIGVSSGDQNHYRYVRNQPLTYVDPSGLTSVGRGISGASSGLGIADGLTMGINEGKWSQGIGFAGLGVMGLLVTGPGGWLVAGASVLGTIIDNSSDLAQERYEARMRRDMTTHHRNIKTFEDERLKRDELDVKKLMRGLQIPNESSDAWRNRMIRKIKEAIPSATRIINPVRSIDPNDKLGPAGYGVEGYIAVDVDQSAVMPYTIRFENMADATAPAHWIRITDTFDEDLDLTTFELTEFMFGGEVFAIPTGLDSYQASLQRTIEGHELVVEVAVALDRVTRTLSASFMALDPATGWMPEDPLIGLLYPNDDNGRGDGSIGYVVDTVAGLETGDEITNKASIFFDWNDPIDTPLVRNTIDAAIPNDASRVEELPETTDTRDFPVTWAGEDDENGSGIAAYDVYVSIDDGPFELWLDGTPETSATFTGPGGHTYAFYSIATDNVGHREPTPDPETADTQTTSIAPAEVSDRHIFYNNSHWDTSSDDNPDFNDETAIAPDKTALLPGETATFVNYTSYSRGVNGIIIDVLGLWETADLSADDFLFRTGNSDDLGTWEPAPAPTTVTVRPGEGVGGSDRVTLIWDDNAIKNQWLEVTFLATPNTGLAEEDIFYFGNAVAETGNSNTNAHVTIADLLLARNNPRNFLNPAGIDFKYDYNRDGRVNTTDVLLARNSQTSFMTGLELIQPPEPFPFVIEAGQFFLHDEPAFLNIISYQPLEPGQEIAGEIRALRIQDDLRRLRQYQGGSDPVVLRVYPQPTTEYPVRMPASFYSGIRELGFWIIRDIYFGDFRGPGAIEVGWAKIDAVMSEVEAAGAFDRIFAWEIGDEFTAGTPGEVTQLQGFLEAMRDHIKERMSEPGRDRFSDWVTWATYPPSDLLYTDGAGITVEFDFYSINVYSYEPDRIRDHQAGPVTGTPYEGYLKALWEVVQRQFPDTPVVISEMGLPDSPAELGMPPAQVDMHPWYPWYRKGGLSSEQVAEGLMDRYVDARLAGLVSGISVFEWNDEWHKTGNPNSQDDPEEFFGIGRFDELPGGGYELRCKLQQETVHDLFTLDFYAEPSIITGLIADDTSLALGASTTVRATIDPAAVDPVRFRWESNRGCIVGDSDTVQFFAGDVALGPAEVTLVAIDGNGRVSRAFTSIDVQAPGEPSIQILTLGIGSGVASGRVANVDLDQYKVVVYVKTDRYYVQPIVEAPFVFVRPDGYWCTRVSNAYHGDLITWVVPEEYEAVSQGPGFVQPPGTIAEDRWDYIDPSHSNVNDTDNDLLPDDWENTHFGNLGQNRYGDRELDNDKAHNLEEFLAGTSPVVADNDSDADTLPDNWERLYFGTLSFGAPGLPDNHEFNDPDGDGLANATELELGTHPGRTSPDQDRDSLPDVWELRYFGNLAAGPHEDPNGDGLTNLDAYELSVSPIDSEIIEFSVGNSSTPNSWGPSQAPGIVKLREDVGTDGSDRITITCEDCEIRNQWPQVTVLAADTDLDADDVFYFGNAVGEAGNSASDAQVTTIDLLLARNNPRNLLNPAPIDFEYDFNRDQRVNATDVLLARNNQTSFANALELLNLSVSEPPQAAATSPAAFDEQGLVEPAVEAAALPAEWFWLDDIEQPDKRNRPSRNSDRAAEAVDRLLATYGL
ncbi:MAG TPA: RHS repeat-associated core domain-containing protein [Thermoguttaceae bacterium]|nr:RHS repeat-associated core domain-containing protein [Thermoguttaceae bacterium]